MKYELIKSFGNKVVIMITLILLCINGLEAVYQSRFVREEDLEYSTEDYGQLIQNAFTCIEEGRDVKLSAIIIERFSGRVLTPYTYESQEVAFVKYEKYAVYGLVLVALIVIITIDTERKSRMNMIISVTENRNTGIILTKQLSLIIVCVIINVVFFLESIIVHSAAGELNLGMKLYNVPGYNNTLFNGSVLEYKLICTLGICMVHIIAGNLIYIIAVLLKKIFSIITGTVIVAVLLYNISAHFPVKYCFMNVFSFFDTRYLIKNAIIIYLGNTYTYRLWAALAVTAIVMLLINVCNFLIYRVRRVI